MHVKIYPEVSKPGRFASYLRDQRVRSGLTQAEVALALKYTSSQFVSNWERGVAVPSAPALKRICQLYGLNHESVIIAVATHKAAKEYTSTLEQYRK